MSRVIDLVGYSAAVLTTLAFVPQVVKTWRTKSARDLSGLTLGAFSLGVFLWLVYGIALSAPPIIVANATTFVLAVVLVGLKVRHSPRDLQAPPPAEDIVDEIGHDRRSPVR